MGTEPRGAREGSGARRGVSRKQRRKPVHLNPKKPLVHVQLSDIPPERGRTWANTHTERQKITVSIYSKSSGSPAPRSSSPTLTGALPAPPLRIPKRHHSCSDAKCSPLPPSSCFHTHAESHPAPPSIPFPWEAQLPRRNSFALGMAPASEVDSLPYREITSVRRRASKATRDWAEENQHSPECST